VRLPLTFKEHFAITDDSIKTRQLDVKQHPCHTGKTVVTKECFDTSVVARFELY